MNFIGVLRTIGHDVGIGIGVITPFAPELSMIPVFGPVFATVFQAVTMVDGLIQQPGSGAAKKQSVTGIVMAAHPEVDPVALSAIIDQLVAALNALQQAAQAGAMLTKIPAPDKSIPKM